MANLCGRAMLAVRSTKRNNQRRSASEEPLYGDDERNAENDEHHDYDQNERPRNRERVNLAFPFDDCHGTFLAPAVSGKSTLTFDAK